MNTGPFAPLLLLSLIAGMASSCVSYTTYKDEPRCSIRFTSALAAQVFFESHLSAITPQGNGIVTISLPLPYVHRTIVKDSVRFNAAVRKADRNHDGLITLSEARAAAADETGAGDRIIP